jgi:type VI secretion system protein ImpK
MSEDDDPFLPPDRTLRPRPGAGRRGMPEPAYARVPAGVTEFEPIPESARDILGFGLNPLVRAATPLLLVIGRVRGASTIDVADLRRLAMAEIRNFEERAAEAGIRNEIVLAARYALCAGLDEAVLSTPSGAQSEWAPHPMLVALHREAWGGEKFFEMLDRLLADPARHIDLIELQYLILALGFTGKYDRIARGRDQLTDLQRNVYRTIRTQRGAAPEELSLRWRGLEDRRNRLVRYVPWWVVVAAGLAVVAGTFILYYTWLQGQSTPVQKKLAAIGTAYRPPPPPPPPEVQTLKKLLSDLIARRVLTVDENGGESVVTLRATDMFASASATVNPVHRPTLDRIADELNKLPGTVMVVGHTDAQQMRSFLFRDNYHLSKERAVDVARILRERLKEPSRVTEERGAGPDKPLDPGNPDRNRRVEIIHRHES